MEIENQPQGITPPADSPDVASLQAQLAEREAELAKFKADAAAVPTPPAPSVPDAANWENKFQEIEKKLEDYTTAQVTAAQEEMLNSLVGEDTSLKERVVAQFNRLKDPADTPTQVQKKLQDAYLLAEGRPYSSPFVGGRGTSFQPLKTPQSNTNFADTDAGKSLAQKLNMQFIKKQP